MVRAVTPSLPGRARIVACDDHWSLAIRGRLMVTVWRTDVTVQRVNAVDRAISDLLLSCEGQGYGSITVIEPTLSMRMPDDAREASTALQRRWGTEMKCSAYLVEGSGFLPAAVRTMTAGMALVTRSPYPVKVFSDGPGCASWVGPVVDLTGLEVERAVKEARSAR